MRYKEELNMMFDEINDDRQRYVLAVLRGEFERERRLARPRLRLVDCSNPVSDLIDNKVNPLPVFGAG